MRYPCWLALAALVVSGCSAEEISRRKNLREGALGNDSLLSRPDDAELKARMADWSDANRQNEQWRESVSKCLPPLISLESMITPPGNGEPFSVESRLKEMNVSGSPDRKLIDNRGKTIYVPGIAVSDGEQTIPMNDLSTELSRFYQVMIPPAEVARWRAAGGAAFLNLSSEHPAALSPYPARND